MVHSHKQASVRSLPTNFLATVLVYSTRYRPFENSLDPAPILCPRSRITPSFVASTYPHRADGSTMQSSPSRQRHRTPPLIACIGTSARILHDLHVHPSHATSRPTTPLAQAALRSPQTGRHLPDTTRSLKVVERGLVYVTFPNDMHGRDMIPGTRSSLGRSLKNDNSVLHSRLSITLRLLCTRCPCLRPVTSSNRQLLYHNCSAARPSTFHVFRPCTLLPTRCNNIISTI